MATVKDDICGMYIDPDATVGKEEYEAKIYYFFAKASQEKFKAAQQNYTK